MGVVDHLTDVIYVTAIVRAAAARREDRQHLSTSKERVNDTLLDKCPFLLNTSSNDKCTF